MLLRYKPPRRDQAKGVIQSKSGKDAKKWKQKVSEFAVKDNDPLVASQDSAAESEIPAVAAAVVQNAPGESRSPGPVVLAQNPSVGTQDPVGSAGDSQDAAEVVQDPIEEESQAPTEVVQDPLTSIWTYNGHTYQLIQTAATWNDARRDAIARGGYLAEISSAGENAFLFEKIRSLADFSAPTARDGGGASYVWLGGTDALTEGSWIWDETLTPIDGQAFSAWGSGALGSEPDNYTYFDESGQDALAMGLENWPAFALDGEGFGNAGQWNDLSASNALFYVVEYDNVPLS